jgi:PBP1b-binding outer membrane lipoprotein LpoB
MKTSQLKPLLLFLFLSLIGCSPVSEFNQAALDETVSVKTDALNLISKANDDYLNHQSEIESLKVNVENAYGYSKTIPNNTETIAQWEIIRDPQRSSLFGLLELWKSKTKLSDTFISQVKILIASDFNAIIDLENNKRK